MIFDTHAHYDDEAFDKDRESLLESMEGQGVRYIVNVGANMESTRKSLMLAKKYPFVYSTVGIHPSETKDISEEDILQLKSMALDPKVVAVGEIGLDYYWQKPDRSIQKKWFKRQLELASEMNLPVVVHSRDAAQDTLEMLKNWQKDKTSGVIHCFSYTKETAREYLKMDYYFGIGGGLTFKNAKKLAEAVEYIPMDRILLETDCPYLAPEPYRGKRNQSGYIYLVAQKLSEIKGISKEDVLMHTMRNARNFYKI